jgi:hypothetical protein
VTESGKTIETLHLYNKCQQQMPYSGQDYPEPQAQDYPEPQAQGNSQQQAYTQPQAQGNPQQQAYTQPQAQGNPQQQAYTQPGYGVQAYGYRGQQVNYATQNWGGYQVEQSYPFDRSAIALTGMQLFQKHDWNGSGTITMPDFPGSLWELYTSQGLTSPSSWQDIQYKMQMFDMDRDG